MPVLYSVASDSETVTRYPCGEVVLVPRHSEALGRRKVPSWAGLEGGILGIVGEQDP
jgi:hypothetical protein